MKRVLISKLPPARKQKAWALIQKEAPALAEFMQSETYRLFRDKLGCSVVLTLDKGHIVTKTWKPEEDTEANALAENKLTGKRGETRGKH